MRMAEQARPVCEELVEVLRASTLVHADEIGWRIGTLSAWLWVFTNREVTVYTVRRGSGVRAHQHPHQQSNSALRVRTKNRG